MPRLTPAQIRDMNTMYGAGYSTREVAAKFQVSTATVSNHLDPGTARVGRFPKVVLTEEQVARARTLFEDGWTVKGIAADLGVAQRYVSEVVPHRDDTERRKAQKAEARRLFDAGETYTAIATAVGVSDRVVRGWLPKRPDHEERSARHVTPTFVVEPGVNDLGSQFPTVAAEWHPTRNGDLTPADVSYGERTEVWWLCSAGHEWQARINTRTSQAKGCRRCDLARRSPRTHEFVQALSGLLDVDVEFAPLIPVSWVPSRPGMAAPVDGFAVVDGRRVAFEVDGASHTANDENGLRRTKALLDQDAADLVVRVRTRLRQPLEDPDPRHIQVIADRGEAPESLAARAVEALRAAA